MGAYVPLCDIHHSNQPSPLFPQAVSETAGSSVLAARLRLPGPAAAGGCGKSQRVILSPSQFAALHSAIII